MKNNNKSFDNSGRKSFNVFLDWRENIDMMTMEERGIFLTMLYDTYQYKSIQPIPEKSVILKVVWNSVKSLIKRAFKDYDVQKEFVKDLGFIDTVVNPSTDSLNTVQLQDSTTITTTTTGTSTGTNKPTITSKDKGTHKSTKVIFRNSKDILDKFDKTMNE